MFFCIERLCDCTAVPIDSKLCDVEIKLDETVVKSATEDDGVEREWCKIIRNSERSSATIQNVRLDFVRDLFGNCVFVVASLDLDLDLTRVCVWFSWSVIVVDGGVVEKGEEGAVRCGTEIVAAPHSQRKPKSHRSSIQYI